MLKWGAARVMAAGAIFTLSFWIGFGISQQVGTPTGPGPDILPPKFQHAVGDRIAGQYVFR